MLNRIADNNRIICVVDDVVIVRGVEWEGGGRTGDVSVAFLHTATTAAVERTG